MKRPWSLAIGIVAIAASALLAAPAPPGTTTASAPTTQPIRLFDRAMARRAEAVTSLRESADFQRTVRERRRTIEARLDAASDAEERITLALGWANWELAEAVAPAATRWVMGYRTRRDLRQFEQAAKAATKALDAVKRDLGSLPESKNTAAERKRGRWRDTLDTLRLFAAAYEALAGAAPRSGEGLTSAREACREAVLGLAELRENEDQDTAAAARLWQAVLLEANSGSRRDLAVLDLALAPPERLPYDFFSRILRCQILLDNGSYPLVAALTLRMEERCERWFASDTKTVLQAKLTLIAVRVNCLWQWADSLKSTEPEEAARQREQADALAAKDFPPDQETKIYRLDRAIPIFVEVPPVKEATPATREVAGATTRQADSAPTSRPTTKPTSQNSATETSQ